MGNPENRSRRIDGLYRIKRETLWVNSMFPKHETKPFLKNVTGKKLFAQTTAGRSLKGTMCSLRKHSNANWKN